MRLIIFSSIFLLLLVASNASAQTPTLTAAGTIVPTGTIPPTSTIPPTATPEQLCLPEIAPNSYVNIRWEPSDVTEFTPGERVTFWADGPNQVVYWIVNGEYIAAVYPTSTPRPTRAVTPTPTLDPAAPTAGPTSPYPAPIATDTPIPTPTPESAYPAPVQASALGGIERCSWPSPDCLAVSMPESCHLLVGVVSNVVEDCGEEVCGTIGIPYTDTPTTEPSYHTPTPTPTHTPAASQPAEPTSIPEPLTIMLFGIGVSGVAGYAKWRR
ncbi:MAG: PEP-CTERM sorting domain-containing protein [Chloroflexota bacterium]